MKISTNKNILAKIILIALGAFITVVVYLIYERFSESITFFLVLLNVIIVILIYVYLHLYYRDIQKKGIEACIKNITAIKNGEKINRSDFSLELRSIYDSIDDLRKHLQNKDRNRLETLNMVNSTASNIELEKLLDVLMPKLTSAIKSSCGAFYLTNNATNKLELKSSVGFSKNIYSEFDVTIGEGFIGQAALSKEIKIIKDMPDDTIFTTRTFLGKLKPKSIMLIPVINQENLMGVLAFATIYDYTSDQLEIVDMIKYYIGAAVGNGIIFEKSKRLTSELQFQNKLIQDLNNELENRMNDKVCFIDNIVDSIDDYAIYGFDRDGIISSWNKGAENIYGYLASEAIGQHIGMVYTEEDIATGKAQNIIKHATEYGKFSDKGLRKKKDGTSYLADVTITTRYDGNGEFVGYANVTKDITGAWEHVKRTIT